MPGTATVGQQDQSLVAVSAGVRTRYRGKTLCKTCRKIDFDSVLRRKHKTVNGGPVRKMGPASAWARDSCPLCELLFKAFKSTREEIRRGNALRSVSTSRISDGGWKVIDTVMLRMETCNPLSFLVPQNKDAPSVRVLQPLVDFDLVKGWLTFCRDNHTKACAVAEGSDPVSVIRSFRLLDCETRRIGPVPDQSFVALSYLWGNTAAPIFSEVLAPAQLETIEDAMTATLALGFKYLWIDRFCINQQDEADVNEHVGKMDVVYSNASLVIIAAAGDGPSYGLPGISPRPLEQAHGRVGKHYFVSTMDDPMSVINESKWMSRGWTYQESSLSRRRLVFLDQQVYFECRGMYCCETLNLPLPDLHVRNMQHFKHDFYNGSDMRVFPRQFGHTGWDVVRRIQKYSERTLSHPEDVLKAFRGVMRALEVGPHRVHHCFGIPALPRPPKPAHRGSESTAESKDIYDNYKWSPAAGLCLGLCWDISQSHQTRRYRQPRRDGSKRVNLRVLDRREGFPSWSWAGWIGRVEWVFTEDQWRRLESNGDLQVRVQLQDGRVITWDEFERSYNDLSSSLSPILHLSAWVTTVRLLHQTSPAYGDQSEFLTWEATVKTPNGRQLSWSFRSTACPKETPRNCMAVHLAQSSMQCVRKGGILVLVIFEKEPNIYERCGFGEFTRGGLDDLEEMNTVNDQEEYMLVSTDETPPELAKSWKTFCLS